jgi:hypothetical protein
MRRSGVLAAATLLAATAASCISKGEEPMETVSMDEAAIQVQDRALAVAAHLDVPLENPSVLPDSCSDPSGNPSETGVFYMTARGQLIVGKDRTSEAARGLHRYFTEQGFEVEEIHWTPNGGQVRATEAPDFGYSTASVVGGTGYAFSVTSPCYQAPDGEDPTDWSWRPLPHPSWDVQPGAPYSPRPPTRSP